MILEETSHRMMLFATNYLQKNNYKMITLNVWSLQFCL